MGRAKGELSGLDPGISNSERLVSISRELGLVTVEVGEGITSADIKIDDTARKGPLSAIVYGLRSIDDLGSVDRVVVLGCDLYLLSKEALGAFVAFSVDKTAVAMVGGVENWSIICLRASDFSRIFTLFDQGERRLSGVFLGLDGLCRVSADDLGDFPEETFVDFDTNEEYLLRFPPQTRHASDN
ncbi:MAG: NTP transferase domain-containing protein [Acidimicrobiaceae bacterium]|nr:NTP transferase domain-containing protein [Acidimicrobiaceae bacterium]